jgi:hypothetical protein
VLSLDADEELETALSQEISKLDFATELPEKFCATTIVSQGFRPLGYWIARKNIFLGRCIKHGGFWPDRKLRLFRRDAGRVEERAVHETIKVTGPTATLHSALIHHAYPTLESYIEHMNRYSSLGAQMAGPRGFNLINICIRPQLTFFYNYILRLGFLDGREGLLLHLYHAVYVSWKYAKAWELGRKKK